MLLDCVMSNWAFNKGMVIAAECINQRARCLYHSSWTWFKHVRISFLFALLLMSTTALCRHVFADMDDSPKELGKINYQFHGAVKMKGNCFQFPSC